MRLSPDFGPTKGLIREDKQIMALDAKIQIAKLLEFLKQVVVSFVVVVETNFHRNKSISSVVSVFNHFA